MILSVAANFTPSHILEKHVRNIYTHYFGWHIFEHNLYKLKILNLSEIKIFLKGKFQIMTL